MPRALMSHIVTLRYMHFSQCTHPHAAPWLSHAVKLGMTPTKMSRYIELMDDVQANGVEF